MKKKICKCLLITVISCIILSLSVSAYSLNELYFDQILQNNAIVVKTSIPLEWFNIEGIYNGSLVASSHLGSFTSTSGIVEYDRVEISLGIDDPFKLGMVVPFGSECVLSVTYSYTATSYGDNTSVTVHNYGARVEDEEFIYQEMRETLEDYGRNSGTVTVNYFFNRKDETTGIRFTSLLMPDPYGTYISGVNVTIQEAHFSYLVNASATPDPSVTAPSYDVPENPSEIVDESQALQDWDDIVNNANGIINSAVFLSSTAFWNSTFNMIFSWSVLGLMLTLVSGVLILRALLGR